MLILLQDLTKLLLLGLYIVHVSIAKKIELSYHFKISFCFDNTQDLESYKQNTKDELLEWHTALKNKNNPDWLIVVINEETRSKSKLLPRSTVIDKVKNDFCSKHTER